MLVGRDVILLCLYGLRVWGCVDIYKNIFFNPAAGCLLKGQWKGEQRRWNDIISCLHWLYSAVVGQPGKITSFGFPHNFRSHLLFHSAGGNSREPCRAGSPLTIPPLCFRVPLTIYIVLQPQQYYWRQNNNTVQFHRKLLNSHTKNLILTLFF